MVQSLQLLTGAMKSPLAQTVEDTAAELEVISFSMFRNAVLEVGPALTGHQLDDIPVVSDTAIAAVQRLVALIADLRSPSSGWQAEQPFTPLHLLPYVSEEAYDVVDALHLSTAQPELNPAEPHPSISPTLARVHRLPPKWLLAETLIPYWLWGVACCAYPFMQLIEGVEARAVEPGQSWQLGRLRLVVMVEVSTEATSTVFDLLTQSQPAALLSDAALIECDEVDWMVADAARGVDATTTLQGRQWLAQIVMKLVPLQGWLDGVSGLLLLEGHDWQPGTVRLQVGLEFVPDAEAEAALDHELNSLTAPDLLSGSRLDAATDERLTAQETDEGLSLMAVSLMRLAHPESVKQYIQAALQPEIAQAIAPLTPLTNDSEAELLHVVQMAVTLVDRNQELCRNLPLVQPSLLLDEVVPKLLWRVTSGAYAVTQFVGGVEAQVLFPRQGWQRGILRLQMELIVTTPTAELRLDLATGQIASSDTCSLDAIADMRPNSFCQGPTQLKFLHLAIQDYLQKRFPEMVLLLQSLPVEWLNPQSDWQPGHLQLGLGWTFTPNSYSFFPEPSLAPVLLTS